MKIAIVGNGSSLLKLKKGQEIDLHDLVIRQNFYYDFLEHETTGVKVDIWSCAFDYNNYNDKELSREVWCARPTKWENGNKWHIRIQRDRIKREINEGEYGRIAYIVNKAGGTNPTTGFLTLKFTQKIYPNSDIDLYGYDFYDPPDYYYGGKEEKPYSDHTPNIEKKLIIEGASNGEYKWIQ